MAELRGVTLEGKAGVKRALEWMFRELGSITFEPGKILVEGDFFFEEFVLQGRKDTEETVRVKATTVLVYEDYQLTQLRLYFDRLTVAAALARGMVEKWFVRKVGRAALRGLA